MSGNTPQLGVGMVGFGFIGKVHAHAYRSLKLFYDPAPADVRLVGVCTSNEETAAKAAQQGEFEFGTTEFARLIERDDIHIIDVATPNQLHRDQVIAALDAGKHVYCDKPLTGSLAEAREILEVASAHPELTHGMAFQSRFVPATMRARQLIAEGALGRVYHFRSAYLHSGYEDASRPLSWRLSKEAGGGVLTDLGSHIIDLTTWLLGPYASVTANMETFITERPVAKGATEMGPVEVEDYVCFQARMRGGALGFVEASRFATGTQDQLEFAIFGEKGALKFDLMAPNWLQYYDGTLDGGDFGGERGFKALECVQRYPAPSALPAPKLGVGWIRTHIHCVYDFIAAIAQRRCGVVTLADGAYVHAVDEAIRESATNGEEAAVATV
ncbi:MAG TPA: Gfo/Idh/MocA family oxidoreductase [Armatimonadota bacterium]|nr:Gfo/Idh/MocA family oxidoreductase [Armatimonadota bacterium]